MSMRRFDHEDYAPTTDRRQARRASIEHAVVVPLVRALITATGFALVSATGAFNDPKWTIQISLTVWIMFFISSWLMLTAGPFVYGMLLDRVERRVGRDLNGDGVVGAPPPAAPTQVTVYVQDKDGQVRSAQHLVFGVGDRIFAFARAVTVGRTTGEREWRGDGRLFREEEYDQLRDLLIQRGLAVWKSRSPRQGWTLTERGRRVFEELAKQAQNAALTPDYEKP